MERVPLGLSQGCARHRESISPTFSAAPAGPTVPGPCTRRERVASSAVAPITEPGLPASLATEQIHYPEVLMQRNHAAQERARKMLWISSTQKSFLYPMSCSKLYSL